MNFLKLIAIKQRLERTKNIFSGANFSGKSRSSTTGQTMILTVIVLSSTLLSITLIGGLIMLYQIRHAGDFTNSGKAIFAADAGVDWWTYYVSSGRSIPAVNNSSSINAAFSNGANFTVEELPDNKVKIIGQAGSSKRALLIESTPLPRGPIPCDKPIDLMILFDRSSSMSPNLPQIKIALTNFLDKLGVGPANAKVGLIQFSSFVSLGHLTESLITAKSYVATIAADLINDKADLSAALSAATVELANPSYDRPDDQSPDYIIIITDDAPNLPALDPLGSAETAAATAKGVPNNIEVLTAYGNTTNVTAIDFYANRIVSTPSGIHFYKTDTFDSYVPLDDMLQCK